jgi:hypothetical protein
VSGRIFWVAAQVAVSEDCECAVVIALLSYHDEGKAKAAREAMLLVASHIDVFLWCSHQPGAVGGMAFGRSLSRAAAAAKAIEAEVRRRWPDALPPAV